jgi:hypothetical protein
LIRTFSNGTSTQYDSNFKSPFFQDTISFKLFKGQINASGNNEFAIVIDPENKIEEASEDNNKGKLLIAIPANGTKNLYPKPYSIENASIVEFIFQDTDLLSASRDYQIEIDTINSFNSPYLKSKKIAGKVLARFSIDLLKKDSLVYYWRTKFSSPKPGESKDWVTSSFTFINASSEGWSQSSDQLTENKFTNLTTDPVKGFSFTERVTDVFVRTFGSENATPYTSASFKINNSEYNLSTQGQPCRNNTINLVAFNKTTTVPYPGIPFNFQDPRTCGREPQLINSFLLSEIETGSGNDLLAYIDNINVSDSVVIFSIGDPGYSSWSSQVKSKLGEFGINPRDIDALAQGEPVVIFGRKGASPGTARIYTTPLVPEKEQELQVSETITGRQSQGKISSFTIGPAKSWERFIANVSNIGPTDSFSFSIFGVKLDGADSLVRKNSFDDIDLTGLNAVKYPYLRLELTAADEVDLTPIQLKNWIVLYEPVAEGILLPNGQTEAKTVQEGEPWSDQFKFVNISNKNFSSLLTVGVELFNSSQLTNEVQKFSIDAPAKQDSTVFTVKVDTKGKLGVSNLNVFVNRKIVPEQYDDNNSISLKEYIEVKPDISRPVLDVSIDGRYIRNNDYVSSNPLILAVLKDENPFLFKTDTSGVNILLSLPCQTSNCGFTRINFSSSEIKWFSATPSSDFRVEYRPLALLDGAYVLRVEAADVTGNKSGEEPYQISFQVKSETTLTFNSVYPNPSSGNFYFQFQLTGNVLPDFFSLEIFTTDGRLVQEFNQEDVIDFKIGLNELIWQATDLAGGSLPNGMFIYRLKIGANEKEVNQQGKLVHIR